MANLEGPALSQNLFLSYLCSHMFHAKSTVPQEGIGMAETLGDGFRRGAVTGRTQLRRPDGHWQKRDERTGQLMGGKDDGTPFKGVAKEPDGRDTPNA
jgi:hypothetical protein